MKNWKLLITGLILIGALAVAGGIKTWSAHETLTASDLNANFQHIHNLMVGGHGARLVNADVSPTAAIAYSKLALAGQIQPTDFVDGGLANVPNSPRGVADINCKTGVCSWVYGGNAGIFDGGIVRNGIGDYTIPFSATRPNNAYTVQVTAKLSAASYNIGPPVCSVNPPLSASSLPIFCIAPPQPADGGFATAVYDADFVVTVYDTNN